MQRQIENQRQQLSSLWDQNHALKQIKDETIPQLQSQGLLFIDQERRQFEVANSLEDQQRLKAAHEGRQLQQSQNSDNGFVLLNGSPSQESGFKPP